MGDDRREKKSTLVLGGTGKTGRRIVRRLTARGDFAEYARETAATGIWGALRVKGG